VSLFILALGATTRPNSSIEKALRVSLAAAAKEGAETRLLGAADLSLPLYAPENPERTPEAQNLVALVRRADGLIIGSPGYHGTISGFMKNALDYVEDLSKDERPYFSDRAVGCVAISYGWQAAVSTLGTLRVIVHALRGWPTPMGAAAGSPSPIFDGEGKCTDPPTAFQLETIGRQVVDFARSQQAKRTVV
jgi:FMN reductase